MTYFIPLLETSYHFLALIINAVVIAVTIRTWNTVCDNIYIRSELIFQTSVLWMSYIIALFIYFCDVMLDGDRDPQYDQVFYLGYFTNSSISSFLSIVIGAQWHSFTPRQQPVFRLTTERVDSLSLDNNDSGIEVASSQTSDISDIAFQAVVATGGGLEAFMAYLAKRNEQNYLIVKYFA